MFALWYGVLAYREYRGLIWNRLHLRNPEGPIAAGETPAPAISPLPVNRPNDTSLFKVPSPPKTPSPEPPRTPSPPTPEYPLSPQATSTPINGSPEAPKPLTPPAKPPRSPSPHPIRAEAFEQIGYEDEGEESSDVEDDEENSVISSVLSSPRRAPGISTSVNEFLTKEANQPTNFRLNQTR